MIGESVAPLRHKGAPDQIESWLALLEEAAQANEGPSEARLPYRLPSASSLCDLAEALSEMSRGVRRRASLRIRAAEDSFELGLERSLGALLASLYSTGASVTVHLFERRMDPARLAALVAAELGRRVSAAPPRESERLLSALAGLENARFDGPAAPEDHENVLVEPNDELAISFGAELCLRPQSGGGHAGGSVLRAEVLPLLFRGKLRVFAGDQVRELSNVHIFLVAERLADLALEALDASLRLRPLWRKLDAGGALCGVRLVGGRGGGGGTGDALAFSLAPTRRAGPRIEGWTFPSLELGAFARAVSDFGRSLTRTLVRWDRSQTNNLRIVELRARLREIAEMCREIDQDDTLVNASPESYRAYGTPAPAAPRADLAAARLRFAPKWTAAVPAIDLRSIFLCGDAFVVGSAREVSCIQRNEGTIAWTRSVSRGVSVMTPAGLARIDEQGQLLVIDVASGETRASLRLEPRVGGPVTGAVVGAPGLPRMLIVSEGRRNLAGIDLEAGEVVWRMATRRGGTFRLKRAGRLVVVSAGEQGLFAIDVVTGEVVWRFRARLRFATAASVCDDSLFAIAGDAALTGGGATRLFHLDPWSGKLRWSVDVPGRAKPVGCPHVGRHAVLVLTLGPRGSRLVAFDRATGAVLYERDASSGAAAALLVDDLAIVNSENGELSAFGVTDGELRYRHVFTETADGDRPRRLEPVLRSGALFVPQSRVHVVRPSDGRLVGAIDTDLLADLLRVDERCDVYVAEESGHVAAFSTVARLSLVK